MAAILFKGGGGVKAFLICNNKRVSQMRVLLAACYEPDGARTDRDRCNMYLNIKRDIF